MMKVIEINGKKYPLIIERKAIKNMYMRINEDLCLYITCNYRISDKQIEDFIYSKQKWIENKIKNREEKTKKGNFVKILGKEYVLIINQGIKDSCSVKENSVLITVTAMQDQRIQAVFYKKLAGMMMQIVDEKKNRWNQMLDDYHLPYPNFQIKKMKSRWGSCTPAKKLIVLNVMLMHYPIECIDAVLLHEYVHLIVPNHSGRFYQIIENHMPNYKQIHALLK